MFQTITTKIRSYPSICLLIIIILACLLRLFLRSGIYGSDDAFYLHEAYKIAFGKYTVSTYVACVRTGYILPVAAIIRLFGLTLNTVLMWSLLTSLLNITLIYLITAELFQKRTALLSALCFAFYPLDISLSGLILPDTSLNLMLTLSVFFYLLAIKTDSDFKQKTFLLLTGICIGIAALNKHMAIIILLFFIFHSLRYKINVKRIVYIFFGGFLIFIIESVYWYLLANDFFYVFHLWARSLAINQQHTRVINTPWFFYLYYLFVSLQHTAIYFYLFLAGALYTLFRRSAVPTDHIFGLKFLFTWGFCMFAVMTFLPIKIDPPVFIPKQTNYILYFSVPFVVLSSYFLSMLKKNTLVTLLVSLLIVSSIICALFNRYTIKSHTFNTEATISYITRFPKVNLVSGGSNNNIFSIYRVLGVLNNNIFLFEDVVRAYRNSTIEDGRSSKTKIDLVFSEAVKDWHGALFFYDVRMAGREGGKYYFPSLRLLQDPNNEFELVHTIRRQNSNIDRIVELSLRRLVGVIRQFSFLGSLADKIDSNIGDLFYSDPAYVFIKR